MTVRLTARARLTVLYTTLVLASGVVLTVLTYFLMSQRVHRLGLFVDGRATPAPVSPTDPETLALAEQVRAETLSTLLSQAAIALAVVTVLAAVLTWLIAGRVLAPIRTISATAQRISAENVAERVPVPTPRDELAALAETINVMLDRVERGITDRDRALASQRMFVANAAHELRTPLTTMRAAVDVTLDGDPDRAELVTMAGDIRTAVHESQRTLDGLLVLARSEAGPRKRVPVDLAELAALTLADTADHAAAGDVTARTDLSPAGVHGEPVLLERMVTNLIDNAIRHNQHGGHLTVHTGTTGAQAFLRVTNTGPPVGPDEVERLFEPFVRGARERTRAGDGLGLGLSILRAVVTAHRGELVSAARAGGGLDLTVLLPRA